MGKKERKKNHILLQKVAWNLAWNCSSNLAAIHTAVAHIIFSQLVFFISIFKTSLLGWLEKISKIAILTSFTFVMKFKFKLNNKCIILHDLNALDSTFTVQNFNKD